MICTSCGINNKEDATRCYGCGLPLEHDKHQTVSHKKKGPKVKSQKTQKRSFDSRLIVPVACGVILLVGMIFLFIPKSSHSSLVTPLDPASIGRLQAKGLTVASMDDKKDIIAQFICPCGKCKIKDDLKDCHCKHPKGAEEVKQYIYERIQENKYSPIQIIEMVSQKYGGRKI
ncbi:MAG: hypothetical protein HUU02_04485 [Bacteroidetes bacterium]|jgi:hypothetical protein|nr:hypothetical protein [Bacteroidota bacterium]